ncbi:MAG TPA: helix-turn-helix transcriptional regulator [Pyrinomonadaceae bacterium]|jgi:transcriptional regulator with XRE-family HTH domain
MGTNPRRKPERLSEKLLEIRQKLGLSQNGMIRRLGLEGTLTQAEISAYERGTRVPSLPTLLEYAAVANVWLDVLADDGLDLPERLPAHGKSGGSKR